MDDDDDVVDDVDICQKIKKNPWLGARFPLMHKLLRECTVICTNGNNNALSYAQMATLSQSFAHKFAPSFSIASVAPSFGSRGALMQDPTVAMSSLFTLMGAQTCSNNISKC